MLLTRYIFTHLLPPFMVITLTLTLIVWLTRSLQFLDLIINKGLGLSRFLYFSTLTIPALLMFILPVALLCAVVHSYQKLLNDRECMVMSSAGVSNQSIANPAILLALLVTALSYLISCYILPLSYQQFKELQSSLRHQDAAVFLQEGIFNDAIKGVTIYIESRQDDGNLQGLLVHDARDKKNISTITAEHGRLITTPKGPALLLQESFVQQHEREDVLYFGEYHLDFSQYAQKKQTRRLESEERYINQLFFPEANIDPSTARRFYAEAHYRLTWPLLCVVLTLLALIWMLSGEFDRHHPWRNMAALSAMVLGVVLFTLFAKSLTARYNILFPLLYTPFFATLGAGYFILRK